MAKSRGICDKRRYFGLTTALSTQPDIREAAYPVFYTALCHIVPLRPTIMSCVEGQCVIETSRMAHMTLRECRVSNSGTSAHYARFRCSLERCTRIMSSPPVFLYALPSNPSFPPCFRYERAENRSLRSFFMYTAAVWRHR